MWETIVTILVILGAGVWLVRWIRGAAKGEAGCACGTCGKSCPSRITEEAGGAKTPAKTDAA